MTCFLRLSSSTLSLEGEILPLEMTILPSETGIDMAAEEMGDISGSGGKGFVSRGA